MRLRSFVGVCFLVALVGVIGSPEAVAAATCNTFDANNTPTSAFTGGDKIVVRGTGFAANSIVLVNLLQGNRTIELDRVRANDLGAFALTDATVPGSVSDGDAAIRALDARGSATCALTLKAGEGDEGSLGGLFWVWGIGLALFGGVLAMLTYRRWKGERLREAVDSLAWREQYEERVPQREPRPEPVTVGGGRREDVSRSRETDPTPGWASDAERPSWVTDGPRPSWVLADDDRGSGLGATRDPVEAIPSSWTPEQPTSAWPPASPLPDEGANSKTWEPARASRDDEGDATIEPWTPGGAHIDEPDDDDMTYQPPVPRPTPERPPPERPLPVRPGTEVWSFDAEGDDDLSAIGAPRPFDDRFALDDADDEVTPNRAAANDDRFVRPEPTRPVVSRPVPQRPVAPHVEEDAWDTTPSGAADGDVDPFDIVPRSPEPVERFDPDRVEPFAPEPAAVRAPEPLIPEPPTAEPFPPATPAAAAPAAPRPDVAPRAPGVQPDRDFASALRDFLDKEDMEFDRRSGIVDPPVALRPRSGLRPQDAGRIPQAPVQPTAPTPVAPAARVPTAPAPTAPPPADTSAAEPVRDAWRPRDAGEPTLQPGPIPQAPRAPSRPDVPAQPQAPVRREVDPPAPRAPARPGSDRGPEPARPGSPWEVDAPSARQDAAPEPSARPGAEPMAFDPLQRSAASRPLERDELERQSALNETDPALPDVAGEDVSEPPVLPVDWDDGRLKPRPRGSDAIARLKREVRNWRR